MSLRTICLSTCLLVASTTIAHAFPDKLTLAARVVEDGVPLDGDHDFRVSLFAADAGGSALWSEDLAAVPVSEGYAHLVLGDADPLGAALFDGSSRFFEIEVDGQRLTPRLELTSVPYAQRAAVAANAETLDGLDSTSFLPRSASSSCTGTNKVTGIDPATGSVVCGPDVDTDTDTSVALAGSGVATTAARSDHNHAGTYLPVGATLACPAGQYETGLSSNGSVVCAAETGDITGVTASTGLLGGATIGAASLSVDFPGSSAFNGSTSQPARSDHVHHSECPSGYNGHFFGPARGNLCIKPVAATNVTWYAAQKSCAQTYQGGSLCTYSDMITGRISGFASVPETLTMNYWLGDRTGDDSALHVNGTTGDNFDGEANITTTTMSGYYCCIRTLDERFAL